MMKTVIELSYFPQQLLDAFCLLFLGFVVTTLLLKVHEELVVAIRDAEEGLLCLKQARLMREAVTILAKQFTGSIIQDGSIDQDVPVEPLNPSILMLRFRYTDLEMKRFAMGSKCRFRYTDGRWYNGFVISQNDADSVKVSFLMPTTERMLVS